jgi:hypothetical protein
MGKFLRFWFLSGSLGMPPVHRLYPGRVSARIPAVAVFIERIARPMAIPADLKIQVRQIVSWPNFFD